MQESGKLIVGREIKMKGEITSCERLVVEGSVGREGAVNTFTLTDGGATVPVAFEGVLPDLFREGQGIIATGTLSAAGDFEASTLLTKHDEAYVPRELREHGEAAADSAPQ